MLSATGRTQCTPGNRRLAKDDAENFRRHATPNHPANGGACDAVCPLADRRMRNADLPPESGLSRSNDGLALYAAVGGQLARLGTSHAGDFTDSPADGWATALAYREHVLRVVQRLREDPGTPVPEAEVDGRGRRLRAWAPGNQSVRPVVLATMYKALGFAAEPGTWGLQRPCFRARGFFMLASS